MYVPVLNTSSYVLQFAHFSACLLSYFKSLPHSTANQGHSIVPSFHKHSPFSFKKKVNMCQSHMVSHLQPSDLFPQEKWSRQQRMIYGSVLLQAAPAVPRAALVTPALVSLPSAKSSTKSIPGMQEALTQGGQGVPLLLLPICRAESWSS